MAALTKNKLESEREASAQRQAALAAEAVEDSDADSEDLEPSEPARKGSKAPTPSGGSGSAPSGPAGPRGPLVASSGGFFHIRKKGQGYWTRMGTAGGAALIGALTLQFIWSERQTFHMSDGVAELVCAIFALCYGFGTYYFMNRLTSVDFLIATDSEMKKVNWTSRKELMGSTKVVIFFMFIIAAFLFVMDIFFGYFFWLIGVLKSKPL